MCHFERLQPHADPGVATLAQRPSYERARFKVMWSLDKPLPDAKPGTATGLYACGFGT